MKVFDWLKTLLPYRCGVRLGNNRLSFLIGNYRPAAIKRRDNDLRLEMGFADKLPKIFKLKFDSQNFPPLVAVGLSTLPIYGPPKLCHAINRAMTRLSGIAVKPKLKELGMNIGVVLKMFSRGTYLLKKSP